LNTISDIFTGVQSMLSMPKKGIEYSSLASLNN